MVVHTANNQCPSLSFAVNIHIAHPESTLGTNPTSTILSQAKPGSSMDGLRSVYYFHP